MKKIIIFAFIIFILAASVSIFAEGTEDIKKDSKEVLLSDNAIKYIAAAIAIGFATFASGIAIGKIGSAAMGAISERPEAGGTAIILAALAEGICLWGFLIAFFILRN